MLSSAGALGSAGRDNPRYGLVSDDGTLPSPRMLPVPIPVDAYRTSFTCRRCGNPSTAKLRELRARGDRAEAAGETVVRRP